VHQIVFVLNFKTIGFMNSSVSKLDVVVGSFDAAHGGNDARAFYVFWFGGISNNLWSKRADSLNLWNHFIIA
jgi:hypothetical protein